MANWLDKAIGFISPERAATRAYYREVENALPDLMNTYQGGVKTRLDTPWSGGHGFGELWGVHESFDSMRGRSRSLEKNNVLASAVLDRACENVVGTGIRLRATTGDEEFDRQANDVWSRFTQDKTADIRRMHTWGSLQRLVYRSKLRDGDVGVVLVLDRNERPCLQIIEAHQIQTPADNMGGRIVDGVEMDETGRPVAYHVRETRRDRSFTHTRIEARDFLFLPRMARYSAVRGEPAFHGGYQLFDQIVGYLDATLVAARIGASQALIISRKGATNAHAGLQPLRQAGSKQQPKGFEVQPGMAHFIEDGDVKGFNPTQPTQNFPDAITTFSRFVGLKFGLTIEQVLLDFSRANYSSSRAARLQAQQTAEQEQDDFHAAFLGRVYQWVISRAINDGVIDATAPDNFFDHEWIPQGRPWVDPTKEIDAAAKAIELGVETRSNIAMERGYDFAELTERNARDEALMRDARTPDLKNDAENYGVAVRAGAITPQMDDEAHFRDRAHLPSMNADVVQAWRDIKIKRPVTLAAPSDNEPIDADEGNGNAESETD